MSNRFRPQLNTLEGRDVPAALSFRLADGTIGSALFSTPDGVDPTLGSQVLAVTDLAVTKGGFQYTTQPGAHANYANGVLVGVVATASGPGDPIQLNLGSVQVGGYVAPVAYDAATTEAAFMLSNGAVGAISWSIDWDQVDAGIANQAIPATRFNLNIGGENFAYGSANFAVPPTALFANGHFVGFNFVLNTTSPTFAYTSIAINNGLQAVVNGVGQQFIADTDVLQTALILDFSTYAGPQAHSIIITGTRKDGSILINTFNIPAGTTPGVARDLFYVNMKNVKFDVEATGDTRLIVKSNTKSVLSKLDIAHNGGVGYAGPVLRAVVDTVDVTPKLIINDKAVLVTPK